MASRIERNYYYFLLNLDTLLLAWGHKGRRGGLDALTGLDSQEAIKGST